ncbi:hypothetical protein [Acinetobacter sp. WCHAc010052]|uniref:hypothetical protein n=1 Tax=Acinetobacter sp. WCHAc010052 TaxID=2004647 RepID=UPI000B3C80F2|nr:hypothetical protein [Acinetobacter sp. WCHAc010052]AXY60190.1 hypothetical protein CDG61_09220 [Acinetobacter sp. WCHAc010052]
MAKQYTALQPVGRFGKGDIVGGLSDIQIQDLLQRGVIKVIEDVPDTPAKAKQAVPAKTEKEVKTDVE